MTEIVDELRALLQLYKIDDTMYTDDDLMLMITQARACIGTEFVEATEHEDYVHDFCGNRYITHYYPVVVDGVRITIDDERVFPDKITTEGIIYFENECRGKLSCTYVQDFSSDDITNVILPLAMYMIRDQNGGNTRSINEGDISITYDNDSQISTGNMIASLVQKLQNKYKARVRLL